MHRSVSLFLLASVSAGCGRAAAQEDYRQVVNRFAEQTAFNGVVLVARGDSVLLAEAHGVADAEAGVPTRLNTRYQLGSVAKWITAVMVLKLADEGALSLTAPIAAYLPDYRADAGRRVTLHHLLTNTSGVPDGVMAAYRADPAVLDEALSTSAAVRRYASGDLRFAPGRQFDYSLANWILVKAVIEQATGASFAENVRALITRPLGLDDTGVFWDGAPADSLAPGYEALAPTPVRADLPAPRYLAAAGGMYSTAPDLLALLNALYQRKLLSAEMLRCLDTVYWTDGDLSRDGHAGGYAYGGRVRAMKIGGETKKVLWHTGSNGPSKVRMSRVLAGGDGLTVLTLTNVGTPPEATGLLAERVLRSF